MKYKKYLTKNNFGLTLNIIGTLLIACAFGVLPFFEGYAFYKNPITEDTSYYRNIYFLNPTGFKVGIGLIVLGFILQLKKSK